MIGCSKKCYARGFCKSHYSKLRRTGELKNLLPPEPKFCSYSGCNENFSAKGFCEKHYREFKVKNNPMIYKNVELRRKERHKKRKQKIVALMGGGCVLCGYKKNMACLDFHHPDPTVKDCIPSKIIRNPDFTIVMGKLEKCMLVCRNCHGEIHHPDKE